MVSRVTLGLAVLLMLVAFLIYNDGIGTIIRMASIYGAGIASSALTPLRSCFCCLA